MFNNKNMCVFIDLMFMCSIRDDISAWLHISLMITVLCNNWWTGASCSD